MDVKYKIINSNVRKTFYSIEDVELYIVENDVKPLDNKEVLEIEKTTVEISKIKIDVPKLSMDGARKFVDKVLNYGDFDINYNDYCSIFYHIIKQNAPDDKFLINALIYHKINEFGITEQDIYSDTIKVKVKDIFKTVLNYLSENLELLYESGQIEFKKSFTNYNPCNAHAIVLKTNTNIDVFILERDGGIYISSCLLVGRNVNIYGSRNLNDIDITLPINYKKKRKK